MDTAIIQLFTKQIESYPNKIALRFENNNYTYSELGRQVSNLSCHLQASGVGLNDKIGVLLPNCPEFVVLMLAVANLGAVLVPQNMSHPAKVIRQTFDKVDVKHFVVWHSIISELDREYNHDFNNEGLWFGVGIKEGTKYQNLNEMMISDTDDCLGKYAIENKQAYIITMTSGSTGQPKPIVLSQRTKVNRATAALQLYQISAQDIILAATPLYHSLAERLVLIPLLSGGTSILMAGFSPKEWLETVSLQKVSFSIAVSSQLKQILAELQEKDYQVNSLRCLVSSSELLDREIKLQLLNHFECDFHECYGTSEVAIVTNLARKESIHKVASVGLAIPHVDVKILTKNKTLAAINKPGEIICKTPMLFSGYYKQDEMTSKSMWNGYFCTGDLGKIDQDGFLYFLGRKKDIIVTGGINVYPKDIEVILNTHPGVVEAAVIALPDLKLGEKVTAVIAVNEEYDNIRELQRLCARELADFQQPMHYIIVDKLPRNSMGKILKHQLVEQYI